MKNVTDEMTYGFFIDDMLYLMMEVPTKQSG
jgi:hypothetical protein